MKVLRNTSWLLIGRMISDGLSLIFYVILARSFGDSGMGDYAFAFALASLLGLGIGFGLRPFITREVARNNELATQYVGSILLLQFSLTIIAGLVLYFYITALDQYPNQMRSLLILAFIATSLRAIGTSFIAFLEAKEAMDKSAMIDVIAKLTIFISGLVFVLARLPLQVVMIAHVLGSAVFLVLGGYLSLIHFGYPKILFSIDILKPILVSSLPFLGQTILYELNSRVDILALQKFSGSAETGSYAVAYRLVSTPLIIAAVVGLAMYPSLSRAHKENPNEYRRLFLSTLKWLGLLGMAGAVILILFGDRIIQVLFGGGFRYSGELARWMAIIFLIGNVRVSYERLLYVTDYEQIVLRLQGLTIFIKVLLIIVLIPRWGALGAVWSSIFAEVFIGVILHSYSTRLVPARYASMAWRLLLSGCVSIVSGLLILGIFPWLVSAVFTLTTFLLSILVLRLITFDDRRQIALAVRSFALNLSGHPN
jgi:O-antigen/teichoic acid export membrane protein